MRFANQIKNAIVMATNSKKAIFAALMMGLCVARTLGDELCARTDGSTIRDKATGSMMMAGAAVVGVSSNRSVKFVTDPSTCGNWSQGDERFPDCDRDGVVTLVDMQCLYECLAGPDVSAPENCTQFDMNGNGTVDLNDVRAFQNRFGTSIGGA